MTREDLMYLLNLKDREEIQRLFDRAYQVKVEYVGNKVYFRGLIEFSNICRKDCFYCGIRKSNRNVVRYQINEDEILESARFAYENHYGSIVLQSGERDDAQFIGFVEKIVRAVKELSSNSLGITLSLGEQREETYRRWFLAGAHRYLLRIETSNERLYGRLHPEDHSYRKRIECLKMLYEIGYQVGTGVMIGLPGQTIEDLAEDILFFKKMDIAMVGMGPYLVHKDTPLSSKISDFEVIKERQLELALKMIAVTRIYLRDVNIASTTALQALDPTGREMGLKAGANIIMPNITGTEYRSSYQLYDNKPCLDENASLCRTCLGQRIESVGETIGFDEWGDSPHFRKT
ncbi:MAG: [FeFe] hydrogenase H-cluster radical SAM maturase HydE, partial [Syntrophus sp. (in: bacteria)]|nr:[FeFe] hydrogenase H-cluster radical SAM maturase HydE [Syntrophus sp. (in: bacteria)]